MKTLKELIAAAAPGFAIHGFTISYNLGMQLAYDALDSKKYIDHI